MKIANIRISMNKLSFFITATDTDVGKTFVTSALLFKFKELGYKTRAIKPIETGINEDTVLSKSDISSYMQVDRANNFAPRYSFKFPSSPHYSAALEGRKIDIDEVFDFCKFHMKNSEVTLIEGAGGVLVPFDEKSSFIDLIKMLDIPVILVISNKLGAINSTLLNIDFLQNHGIEIACIVANFSDENDKIKRSNLDFISQKFGGIVVGLEEFHGDDLAQNYSHAAQKFGDFFASLKSDLGRQNPPKIDLEFDKKHLWHPYTSATCPIKSYAVHYASGKFIYTKENKLLDAMSSWWCVCNGYNNNELNSAALRQINNFSHVMFGGLTHEPAINLGKKLIEILPSGLEHIFYADSGSVSVEVAIKMALQYQHNKNPKKSKILTPYGGYHGDTFGAMSVCDPVSGMHSLFKDTLAKQIFFEKPKCGYFDEFDESFLDDLKQKLYKHKDEIAAIILEPIVQGAGGMWFYHKNYLKFIKEICEKEDIILIFDEIATGFGRTGELFGANLAEVTPDIICIGKALTGGFMSFAATIANKKVAYGISENGGVFMHGPTFMANPLACSVAVKNLELLLASSWRQNIQNIQIWLTEGLQKCLEFDEVRDVRVLGAIGVVELKFSVNLDAIQEFFVQNGVWIRPFGKLIYVMPHFNFTQEDIGLITQTIYQAIKFKKY